MFDDEYDEHDPESDSAPPERSPGDIMEAEKYEFIHLVKQGYNRSEAAQSLGFKGRHFRSICSPKSMFYDEDFAREFGLAIGSLEYEHHRLERLRGEAQRRALGGSDRLLEKLLMVYDPDWEVLRQKTTDVNINIRALVETHFKSLPIERLEQILQWVEENETIDAAQVLELPAEAA